MLIFLSCWFSEVSAQTIYPTRSAYYGELGGKGLIYGLYYENLYLDDLGINVGISFFPSSINFEDNDGPFAQKTDDTSTIIIPFFVSWFPWGERDRIYIDGGLNLMVLHRNKTLNSGACLGLSVLAITTAPETMDII
jgi:hypothetical protein